MRRALKNFYFFSPVYPRQGATRRDKARQGVTKDGERQDVRCSMLESPLIQHQGSCIQHPALKPGDDGGWQNPQPGTRNSEPGTRIAQRASRIRFKMSKNDLSAIAFATADPSAFAQWRWRFTLSAAALAEVDRGLVRHSLSGGRP